MAQLGLPPDCGLRVTDELTGEVFAWGAVNYVRLDPYAGRAAHVLHVEPLR